MFQHGKLGITDEGAIAVQLINKTGAPSVKGTLVHIYHATAVDLAFGPADIGELQSVGAVYENGIPDGSLCFVCIGGIVDVMLQDATASTRGNWVRTSTTTAGRVDATNAAPPGGGIPELDAHMAEVGHALESKGAGVDVLCKIVMHFN